MGWVGGKEWTQEISEVTSGTDYMNCVIDIIDPSFLTTMWDVDTNTATVTGNGTLARGIRARINFPLRPVTDPGTKDANSGSIHTGRCSISSADYSGPLRNGLMINVTNGGDNPDLERYTVRIEEALNAGNMASRVMKIAIDAEATNGTFTPIA